MSKEAASLTDPSVSLVSMMEFHFLNHMQPIGKAKHRCIGKLWQRSDVSGGSVASLASSSSAGGQITPRAPSDTKGVSCQPDNHLTLHSLPPRLAVTQATRGEGPSGSAALLVTAHAVCFLPISLFIFE